ncbi:unnamed protein product [Lactuca virosa]|uniref:Uncharacterized protein n=1 Tax=Lactuca virosa TaxID=75947 RepID=A0AAU9N9I8_9ASTR|nr:unnamed protein product [Lactuca virosa]
MWLLFHHNLQSIMKRNHDDSFLKIEAVKVVEREVRFDSHYLKRLFPNINWETLVYASKTLGYHELAEETPDASFLDSEDFLKKFHHALFELRLQEGAMVCAQRDRRFRIEAGRVKVEMTTVTCINCGFEMLPSDDASASKRK